MLLDTKDLQAKLKISRNRNYALMRVSAFLTKYLWKGGRRLCLRATRMSSVHSS